MRCRGRIALALLLLLFASSWSIRFSSPSADLILGSVHDSAGPVAGAIIRCKGETSVVLSDQYGRFQLPAAKKLDATITAAKEGFFIAGSRRGLGPLALSLRRLPADDYQAYRWIDPAPDAASMTNCANCHAEIYREWSASGHANSIRNRHFLNLFEGSDWHGRPNAGWSLSADHPDGAGVCTACHGPTVGFSDPGYYDPRQVRGVDARGVHCDFCHKINDAPTGNIGLTHGRFGLSLLRPAVGQLTFGPLDDGDRGDDGYSPLYRESRYCAACHEGTVFGVHAYSTYSEWLASSARREGKQCQTCHMMPTGKMTNFAPGKGGIERDPLTLASHRFEGTDSAMLKACLRVALVAHRAKDGVAVRVMLRAGNVGHRVPTGFVDRNLVLVVEPQGPGGRRLAAAAGPTLPRAAGQECAGLPGRIYAKLLGDSKGNSPVPFWRSPPEVTDSRLWPDQSDLVEFRFPSAVAAIRLRLLFRRFWQEIADGKSWPDNETAVIDQLIPVSEDRIVRWSNR
jgi:Cytochrome c554 and c-prime